MTQFANGIHVQYDSATRTYRLTIDMPDATVPKAELQADNQVVAIAESHLLKQVASTIGPILADTDALAASQFYQRLEMAKRRRLENKLADKNQTIHFLRERLDDQENNT